MTAVLREFLDAVESGKPGQWGYKIVPALRALLDEVEGLRVNAERYRWLRDASAQQWTHPIVVRQARADSQMTYIGPIAGTTLDAAIDAARQPSGNSG